MSNMELQKCIGLVVVNDVVENNKAYKKILTKDESRKEYIVRLSMSTEESS